MDALTLFGLIAVTAMLVFYALEDVNPALFIGLCRGLRGGFGLRVPARRVAVRRDRGDLGRHCRLAVAEAGFGFIFKERNPAKWIPVRRKISRQPKQDSEDNVLRDDINNALKDAMKAKDERKVSTLRLMNSTIKNADIEARGAGKPPLSDGDLARRIPEDDQAAPGIERAVREGRPA